MKQITWTAKMDAIVVQGRIQRRSWDEIGHILQVSQSAAQQRGTSALGLPGILPRAEPESTENLSSFDKSLALGRPETAECLPAGSAFTWALLTAGTCLDGQPYLRAGS